MTGEQETCNHIWEVYVSRIYLNAEEDGYEAGAFCSLCKLKLNGWAIQNILNNVQRRYCTTITKLMERLP